MGRIQIGISSPAEAELVKSGFYPAGIKTAGERFGYYAFRFSVTEIDASYHYFPTRRNMSLWLESTPPGFTYDVRAFSLFTGHPTPWSSFPKSFREKYASRIEAKGNIYPHHVPDEGLDELWGIFISDLEAFRAAGKLGAALFQFPPWFHPEPANYEYLAECRARLPSYPLAVEFRAGSWLESRLDETLRFLRRQSMALVCVDEPQGFKSSLPPVAEATSRLGVIRFHGRNRETWEAKGIRMTEKFNYLYSREELEEWAPRLRAMAAETDELHVIFKNKHADFPVRNALEMQELLGTA